MSTSTTSTPSLSISELDFDTILSNFREYLKSQDKFKDYNFDGSAISELLKLLAYNTFYNSFYVNNVANEMYLDTATERSSVVSRAKALGYSSTSAISSNFYVNLSAKVAKVTGETAPTSSSFITLMPYAAFSTTVQDTSYNFLTTEQNNLYYVSEGTNYWVYEKANVQLKEGKALKFAWKVQGEYEKYIIPNSGVDVNSLIVRVFDSSTSTTYTTFSKASNFTYLTSEDAVFWINEGEDSKFYLEFGNDIYGKKLSIGNLIYVEYIVTNGASANGSKVLDINIGDYSYSNTNILETEALTVTNSNFSILTLEDVVGTFDTDSLVRGLTSNNTAYVYSYANNVLKVYGSSDVFVFNEIVREETVVNGTTIYGTYGTIKSLYNEISTSTGGSDIEQISSIKFNAPKFFSSQNRLVVKGDYESVIMEEYPFVESVSCWGGEDEDPQVLGNVYISVKPKGRDYLDFWEKEYLLNDIIEPKKMIGLTVNIIDLDYTFVQPTIDAKYTYNLGSDSNYDSIYLDIINSISNFNNVNCNKFNNSFYYSNFVADIDNSNQYILSNSTSLKMYKKFRPTLNISYANTNNIEYGGVFNYSNAINTETHVQAITSSNFTCEVANTNHSGCFLEVDSVASTILNVANSTATVVSTVGSIDYVNGIVSLYNIKFTDAELRDSSNNAIINIYANPAELDLSCTKKQILTVDIDNVVLSLTPIKENK